MSGCGHSLGADIFSMKTASYSLMHFTVAILVAYALTMDWRKALAIGVVEPIVQTFAFALHDRYWRGRGERASDVAPPRPSGDCSVLEQA